jgi:REP element-mobilizing transposase RayT
MSRPLRIEYPDAWHHVMNRGRRGESVFRKDEDYLAFIEVLKDAVDMWNLRVGAYCLMGTHYLYVLLQTPDANLSRYMMHIDGVYTQYFNRSHGLDGHLFRGRYKSMLIGINNYSSVSTVVERTKQKASTDRALTKRVEKLKMDLIVSQEQTPFLDKRKFLFYNVASNGMMTSDFGCHLQPLYGLCRKKLSLLKNCRYIKAVRWASSRGLGGVPMNVNVYHKGDSDEKPTQSNRYSMLHRDSVQHRRC